MQVVDKKKYEEAEKLPSPKASSSLIPEELTEETLKQYMDDMMNPVDAQRRLAAQIKHFLDNQVKKDMKEKGYLSDYTRRWAETYNNLLEKIQKALYGDKSVNLHLHKVSISQVAQRIRQAE